MLFPFSVMGSAFQAMEKKDIVRDGEGSSRKNVQVKLRYFFWCCLQD